MVNSPPIRFRGGGTLRLRFPLFTHFALATTLFLGAGAGAQEVKLNVLSTGAMQKMGGYIPQRVELTATKPTGIKKLPPGVVAPLFGKIEFGPKESPSSFYLVLDEPEGKPAHLFVDANANGDFTDDPPSQWDAKTGRNQAGTDLTTYSGGTNLVVPYGEEKLELHVAMYRFDKTDPQRAAFASTLFYYSDYAREGTVTLAGKSYPALLSDNFATGDFRGKKDQQRPAAQLFIDLNGDGKFDRQDEAFDVNKPFNIGGTTYEIADLTASGIFKIVKSSQTVPETTPAPNLKPGQPALAFEATTTDQRAIKFPQSYQGKLVLLDFWATWCAPCRAELPHLTAAYAKFHGAGFEVLGISLDRDNEGDKLAKFTEENKMPWPQVYDGKFWLAEVAKLYRIHSIPSAFLVDGNTGRILASGEQLRSDMLEGTLEKALPKKP